MNKQKVLNLLGLANRARKLVAGEDTVLRLLKQKKLKIVFVASDASLKQIDKFEKKCFFYETKMNNDYTCDELSNAIGKPMCKILAVTDQGFLDALNKSLNGGAINEG
ncbi:MAG: ribosomal L7Ae/L30e/S12e/Gadd45 family protein [Bacilli bacterium]|nr:ribosomal L7Ae/L30e/S12e/Gadd45 family protein [Bacilli bacterium]